MNKTVCGEDGGLRVFTKKRITRQYDEFNFVGLECDDNGEWKKSDSFDSKEQSTEWCMITNVSCGNDYRMPRQIEFEKFHTLFNMITAFMADPSQLTLHAIKESESDGITSEAILDMWLGTCEAAQQSMSIAVTKVKELMNELNTEVTT